MAKIRVTTGGIRVPNGQNQSVPDGGIRVPDGEIRVLRFLFWFVCSVLVRFDLRLYHFVPFWTNWVCSWSVLGPFWSVWDRLGTGLGYLLQDGGVAWAFT